MLGSGLAEEMETQQAELPSRRFHFFSIPHSTGTYSTVWEIFDDKAVRIGVPNAETLENCHCVVSPGQSGIEAISHLLDNTALGKCRHWPLTLDPGQYYPRIARPSDQHAEESPGSCPGAHQDSHSIAMALGQLDVLTQKLEEICQTVHPAQETFGTYGHAIRNLLILACTEVEAHWRGVLVANGSKQKQFSTADYVKLLSAMQLNKYSVDFPYYPWVEKRRPFSGWNSITPTQSLSWYGAYNSAKHDREKSFSRATLGHVFDAVSACAIMMYAQYGYSIPGWGDSHAARFFNINERPVWAPSEVYTLDYKSIWAGEEKWIPINYPFSP